MRPGSWSTLSIVCVVEHTRTFALTHHVTDGLVSLRTLEIRDRATPRHHLLHEGFDGPVFLGSGNDLCHSLVFLNVDSPHPQAQLIVLADTVNLGAKMPNKAD